jgi:hypothetical protein
MSEGELYKNLRKMEYVFEFEARLDEAKDEIMEYFYSQKRLGGTIEKYHKILLEIADIERERGIMISDTTDRLFLIEWCLKWFGEAK